MGNAGGTRRSWKSTPVIHRAAGSRNKEAIRRSEPIIIRWQPTEAAEQVFVCLVFFLQTIIKAVRRHRFSCHDYLHVNLTSSMWRQIISSLIRSKANCDYFLKKTLLFMRKLLSTNWVFHEFSLGSQAESCFYYLLPLYNQLFNGDDSFQPRKSNVFFLRKTWQTEGKKCWAFPGSEETFWVLLFSPQIYTHVQWHMLPMCAGREFWPPWELWTCISPKRWGEKVFGGLKWRNRGWKLLQEMH